MICFGLLLNGNGILAGLFIASERGIVAWND